MAFTEYHCAHSPSQRRTARFLRVGFTGFFLILGLLVWMGGSFLEALPAFLFAALWFSILPAWLRRGRRRTALKMYREFSNRGLTGRHEARIGPEGLAWRSEGSEGRTNWAGIDKIGITPDHTFVYLSAMNAMVIPRKTVIAGDYEAFVGELQTRVSPTGASSSAGV